MSLISLGFMVTGLSTAACRSNPAACSVIFSGRDRPRALARRLIFTVIGRARVKPPEKMYRSRAPEDRNCLCVRLLFSRGFEMAKTLTVSIPHRLTQEQAK